ncbi:AMP-binding protein [Vibrio sp.]|uniref:phenylacetate--CoA ligase family protein n=1 Tax=Vibrio sp. TaxID=678 RepID=UPI00311E5ABB
MTLDNLHQLPFTTKDDLREQMLKILSGSLNDGLYYYETTGTTGPATPCPRDINESYASNLQLQYAYEDMIKAIFPANHKPILGILGPTEVHSFSDTLGSIASNIGICHAKIWPGSPIIGFDKCLNLIRDLNIEIIATSPGQVMTLAKEAIKRGLDPKRDFKIKAFMLSGELCTPELAENLESIWGAKVYNSLYGSQEAFVIASCTPNGKLRPHLPNYIIELIDPITGKYLGETGEGELVVTCLVDGLKPLIRYRTGDIVSIRSKTDKPLFEKYEIEVVGRVKDSVKLNNSYFTAAQIESSLIKDIHNCLGYQIVLTNSNDQDSIIAKLEIPGLSSNERRSLITETSLRILKSLGCNSTIMIVDDLSEHVNLGGWIKWKAARLIDSRLADEVSEPDAELSAHDLMERLNNI